MTLQSAEVAERCLVGSETIRHDGIRNEALSLEQFSQQFQRCLPVPSLLDQDIKDLAFLVDGPPHEHPIAANSDDHLVQMPDAISRSAPLSDV